MPFSVTGAIGTVLAGGASYTQLKAKEDGNCLFHSIGYLLERMGKTVPAPTDHGTLRTRACDKIHALLTADDTPGDVKERCRGHVYDAMNVRESGAEAQAAALTQYVTDMRRVDVAWGDLLCVYALELVYAVRIQVYHLDHTGASANANFPNAVGDGPLRIVTPYTGRRGYYNHYNPLVSDPTDLEKVPAAAADPVEKGPSDPKQWEYWNEKNLFLYQPASCHSQYADLWTPTPPPPSRPLAVSNSVGHVVDAAKPRVAKVTLGSPRMKARSASFDATIARDTLDVAFVEPFMLTLARDKGGKAIALADTTDATIEVDLTLFESVDKVQFGVFTRGKPTPVAGSELLRPALEKLAKGASGDQKLTIPLADVFTEEELRKLKYSESPYRLVACTNGMAREDGVDSTQWSFTYFHLPDPWDVNTPEGVQAARIIPLEDSLAGLRKLKAVATVSPRSAESDTAVKAPPGVGDEDVSGSISRGAMSAFLGKLRDAENQNYTPASQNIFWQLPDDTYYVATSWASIIVLVLDKDGDYEAHSILTHGSPKVFVATKPLQTQADALGDRRYELLKSLQFELKVLGNAQKGVASLSTFDRGEAATRRRTQARAQALKVQEIVGTIRSDVTTLHYITGFSSAWVLEDARTIDDRVAQLERALAPLAYVVDVSAAEVAKKAVRTAVHNIDGEGDFEGFRPGRKPGWKQVFLEPGMKVKKVITQGISSCAGGVTFVNEALPKVLILWHIDFPPYVPIKSIIDQLWPDAKTAPDLRTIGFVFPDCGELNKYRNAQLYPADLRDRSRSVFMTRGDHLGVQDFSLGSGAEYFGLDLANKKRVDLVFTHDLNKRTEMVSKRQTKATDAEVSITLDSFHKNVFGRYRYDGIPVEGHDRVAMRTYTAKVANSNDTDVKRHKLGICSVVRLQGVGNALFDAMNDAAKPVLETPCYMLGLRVEQEFALADPKDQAGRLFRTGHQERDDKPKDH